MSERDPFDSLQIPPPDPVAKRRAIAAARERFVDNQAAASPRPDFSDECVSGVQGWRQRLRLMFGNVAGQWSSTMTEGKRIMTAVATACLLVVAINIAQQQPGETRRVEDSAVGRPVIAEADLGTYADADTVDEASRTAAARPLATERAAESVNAEIAKGIAAIAPAPLPDDRRQPPAGIGAEALESTAASAALPAPTTVPSAARQRAAVGSLRREASMSRFDERLALQSGAVAMQSMRAEPGTPPPPAALNRDRFPEVDASGVKLVSEEPVSTFSADVDTASYSFVRRVLNDGRLPPPDAVRAEEMLNYFDYAYPEATDRQQPFEPTVLLSDAPWAEDRQLLQIGIRGFDLHEARRPRSNLVFLLDVSGSMRAADKLPLVKQSMQLLLSTLQPEDSVAIAVYAGAAGVVLPPTPVKDKQKILDALRQLEAGGSTSGAEGIRLAYELAASRFEEHAVNRVILATDGDFNVGIADPRSLEAYVARQRDSGIFLSVLGFGRGNYNDELMQALAQSGNGIAAYIDTLGEAQKVLVHEATSTLFPIAGDVKLQVEFNPARVAEYRLIGYETRALAREDFANDRVDAGDIGAGHTVTALYEIALVGSSGRQIPASRYAAAEADAPYPDGASRSAELAFLRLRYKLPGESESRLMTRAISDADRVVPGSVLDREARFAAAVAGAAQLLKNGREQADIGWEALIALAQSARGDDPFGYRTEFVQLLRKAQIAQGL